MARVRVAACQINTVVGDLEGNARRILGALDEAERGRADLAVFPELAVTGYPPEDLLGRPAFVTDNRAVFAEIAASTGTCAAVVGYVDTDRAGRLVNAAAMCAGGRVVGRYFKRLLPNYGVFDEQRWSVPGGEPPLLVEDPVVGQQALEVSADHAATCAHGRGIDQSPGPIGVDVPDHGRTGARGRGDLGEHRPVVGHEGRPAQEILGRVPGDRQFGEDGQVRTAALCLVEGNARRILGALDEAERGRADLAVFPELAVTGYPPEDLLGRPAFVTDNRAVFAEIAASTGTCAAVVGYVDTDRAGRLVNAAAMCAGGRVVGRYFKRLLPNYGVFDEQRWFAPGDGPPTRPVVAGVPVGMTICEDMWFAQGPMVDQSAAGARLLVNLNASPYSRGRRSERLSVLADRVAETLCPIVYVNQVGGQDELVFDGASLVMDPDGVLLASARQFEEEV